MQTKNQKKLEESNRNNPNLCHPLPARIKYSIFFLTANSQGVNDTVPHCSWYRRTYKAIKSFASQSRIRWLGGCQSCLSRNCHLFLSFVGTLRPTLVCGHWKFFSHSHLFCRELASHQQFTDRCAPMKKRLVVYESVECSSLGTQHPTERDTCD